MGGKPVPKKSFLNECLPAGAPNGQKIWKSEDSKRIYTWDSLHGEIEMFNGRGKHLGVLNVDGDLIKDAVKGRKINVK